MTGSSRRVIAVAMVSLILLSGCTGRGGNDQAGELVVQHLRDTYGEEVEVISAISRGNEGSSGAGQVVTVKVRPVSAPDEQVVAFVINGDPPSLREHDFEHRLIERALQPTLDAMVSSLSSVRLTVAPHLSSTNISGIASISDAESALAEGVDGSWRVTVIAVTGAEDPIVLLPQIVAASSAVREAGVPRAELQALFYDAERLRNAGLSINDLVYNHYGDSGDRIPHDRFMRESWLFGFSVVDAENPAEQLRRIPNRNFVGN